MFTYPANDPWVHLWTVEFNNKMKTIVFLVNNFYGWNKEASVQQCSERVLGKVIIHFLARTMAWPNPKLLSQNAC